MNYDEKDFIILGEKTEFYCNIFKGKKVYVKSVINVNGNEFYTNYNPFDITDFQYGPDFIYIYGPGKDQIIISLHTIISITQPTNTSLQILSQKDRVMQEFTIQII